MSITATNRAWEMVETMEMSIPARLVLLALAHRHNQETGRCDPGKGRISKDTGLSMTAVKTALNELQSVGAISIRQRKSRHLDKHKHLTNRYIIGRARHDLGVGRDTTPNMEVKGRLAVPSSPHDVVIDLFEEE